MKTRVSNFTMLLAAMLLFSAGTVAADENGHAPEEVFHLMSVKFWRGIVNVATCPLELPKQVYVETRDLGVPGPVVGVLKGVWMTGYRAVCGVLETGLFFIPQPGDYEPLANPAFVWQTRPEPKPEPTE